MCATTTAQNENITVEKDCYKYTAGLQAELLSRPFRPSQLYQVYAHRCSFKNVPMQECAAF